VSRRCANPPDCTELVTCIKDMKAEAQAFNHSAFFYYLDSAPIIRNPGDSMQCGKTRYAVDILDLFVSVNRFSFLSFIVVGVTVAKLKESISVFGILSPTMRRSVKMSNSFSSKKTFLF